MKERLVILGAGGHAKVVIFIVQSLETFDVVGICDDDPSKLGSTVLGVPVKWRISDLPSLKSLATSAFVGVGSVGDSSVRIKLFDMIKEIGFRVPTIISPQAILADDVTIEEGTVIMPGAIVNPGTRIGRNCIINTGSIVDHDCVVEDHVHIAPGATLSGGVHISKGAHIGTGASIIQRIHIGEFAIVGAGAVVVKDVPPNVVVVGVPAKPIEKMRI